MTTFPTCLKCGRLVLENASVWQREQGNICLCGPVPRHDTRMPVEERNGIVSTPAPRLQGTPVVQFVTLPYPPTANNFKVPIVRGTRACMTLSAEARTWKGVAELRVSTANLVSLNGPVKLDIHVYRPRKVGDLDNAIKLSVDALSKYAYYDDEQVTEIHAYRHDDKANPRVEISIERAEE